MVLVPIYALNSVHGAFGSVWKSTLCAFNGGSDKVEIKGSMSDVTFGRRRFERAFLGGESLDAAMGNP